MARSPSPLLAFLADHNSVLELDPDGWGLLFAEARACGLVQRLAAILTEHPLSVEMPRRFTDHLLAAGRQSEALVRDVHRELGHLHDALQGIDTPVLLLKGAAYVAAGLPPAKGRVFSDIDILVERNKLAAAESALMLSGWIGNRLSAYDQRYYREWSHEIPPLTHIRRGTTIDLHHSLAMPTCHIRIDSAKMVADAVPIAGTDGWWRLCDEDLVLHAAAHLLLNSEFDRGLRDLGDIDLLLRHFSAGDCGYLARLLLRAREVGLERILLQALGLCRRFYRTPGLAEEPRGIGSCVSVLLACSATTRHPDTRPAWQEMADVTLMLRELTLRLPAHLLLRHLWHKMTTALAAPAPVV